MRDKIRRSSFHFQVGEGGPEANSTWGDLYWYDLLKIEEIGMFIE